MPSLVFQNYVSFKPSAIVNSLFRLGQRGISELTESTRKYDRAGISKKPMGARNRVIYRNRVILPARQAK
jgi:hypothetical protein